MKSCTFFKTYIFEKVFRIGIKTKSSKNCCDDDLPKLRGFVLRQSSD